MTNPQVKEYEEKGGVAESRFSDNSLLQVIPYAPYGNFEGLDSVLLYQSGTLEALATDRPYRYTKPEERGFWSNGRISQQQLAEYWNAAVQVGQSHRVLDKEFWRIVLQGGDMRQELAGGRVKIFEKNPGRFKDRI